MNLHTLKRQRLPEYERFFLDTFSRNVIKYENDDEIRYYDKCERCLIEITDNIIYVETEFICFEKCNTGDVRYMINKYLNINIGYKPIIMVMPINRIRNVSHVEEINLMK